MTRVPLMVELCAGTAALSLRLAARGAKPPVSRMGSKSGYADVLLELLGLRPGQGADAYLWCEPDAGVRLLLEAYRSRALALGAAEAIRGWKDEGPRALWDRLRAEGPAVCPPCDAREVARYAWVQRRSAHAKGDGYHGGNETHKIDADAPASALSTLPTLPATIHPDARTVDPREVARWMYVTGQSVEKRSTGASWFTRPNGRGQKSTGSYASDLAGLPSMVATIHNDARTLDPPQLPPGTIAYMDPPYVGTTGYADALPREDVLTLARRWSDAGAVVAISEAVRLDGELGEGWWAADITGERKGQRRTFSRQQREWVTMNREPAVDVNAQVPLW